MSGLSLAYQTILQSQHNDFLHNMRLLSDVWKGVCGSSSA